MYFLLLRVLGCSGGLRGSSLIQPFTRQENIVQLTLPSSSAEKMVPATNFSGLFFTFN